MTERNETRKQEDSQVVRQSQEPTREYVYVPYVDISEGAHCIRLTADMPGVDKSSIDVTVENNVLSIEGSACVDVPEGYELVGQEFGVGRYRRDFTLSEDVDTANIKARVNHGVLELSIPKREEVKARKIEIGT